MKHGIAEANNDNDLIRKLKAVSNYGSFKRKLFTQYCGADVNVLWQEFSDSLRSSPRS